MKYVDIRGRKPQARENHVQRPGSGSQFHAVSSLGCVQVLINYKQHCNEYILVATHC